MTLPIQVGIGGYAGLTALDKIEERRKELLSQDQTVIRQLDYLKDRMEFINSADDLVDDNKLFKVALGAFGLEDQEKSRALIKKVLSSDLDDKESFANRIPDKRLLRMAEAFDFYRRAHRYSKEDGDFLKRIALTNADTETQNKVLKLRDKILELIEPYDDAILNLKEAYLEKTTKDILAGNGDAGKGDLVKPSWWDTRNREWYHILKDPDMKEIVKKTFGFGHEFDFLFYHKKIEKINEKLATTLNIQPKKINIPGGRFADLGAGTLFYELGKQKNLDRLFRTYAHNAEKVSHVKEKGLKPEFIEKMSEDFIDREFERRVGLADESMRLSLNARREITALAERKVSTKTLWLEVIGNPPLRKVFTTAFGFGPNYAKLDVDRQAQEFEKASKRFLGTATFKEIGTPKKIEKLLRIYLARSELAGGNVGTSAMTGYSSALSILTSGGAGSGSNPALTLLQNG